MVNRHLPGASTIRGENIKSSLFQIQCDIVLVERQPFNYLRGIVSWALHWPPGYVGDSHALW